MGNDVDDYLTSRDAPTSAATALLITAGAYLTNRDASTNGGGALSIAAGGDHDDCLVSFVQIVNSTYNLHARPRPHVSASHVAGQGGAEAVTGVEAATIALRKADQEDVDRNGPMTFMPFHSARCRPSARHHLPDRLQKETPHEEASPRTVPDG